MDKANYQEFVETLIKYLVDHPEEVSTEKTVDERGVLITLKINPEDMGYVIGRQGQNARAVRTLLRLVGARSNARVTLKIEEPEGSQRPQRSDRYDNRAPRSEKPAQEASADDVSVDDLNI